MCFKTAAIFSDVPIPTKPPDSTAVSGMMQGTLLSKQDGSGAACLETRREIRVPQAYEKRWKKKEQKWERAKVRFFRTQSAFVVLMFVQLECYLATIRIVIFYSSFCRLQVSSECSDNVPVFQPVFLDVKNWPKWWQELEYTHRQSLHQRWSEARRNSFGLASSARATTFQFARAPSESAVVRTRVQPLGLHNTAENLLRNVLP